METRAKQNPNIIILCLIFYFPFLYYGQMSVSTFVDDSFSAGFINYLGFVFNILSIGFLLGKSGLNTIRYKKGIIYPFLLWIIMVFVNSLLMSDSAERMFKNFNYATMWATHFLMYYVIARHGTLNEKALIKVFAILTMLSSFLVVALFNVRNIYAGGIELGGGLNSSYFVICLLPWLLLISRKYIKIAFIAVAVAAVLFSMKRTSMVVLALQLIAFLVLRKERSGFISKLITSAILAVGIAYIFLYVSNTYLDNGIMARIEMTETDEMGGRSSIWRILMQKFEQSGLFYKLIGHGCNSFIEDSGIHLTAHSDYYEILYDFGIIGLILLLVIIISFIKKAKPLFKHDWNMGVSYIISLLAFLVIMSSSHLLFIHPCQIIFLSALWGYMIGVSDSFFVKKPKYVSNKEN